MPNRKARRAALKAKTQKAKMEKADDSSDPTADHIDDALQEHKAGAEIAEGQPTKPDSIAPKHKSSKSSNKPQPLKAIMKVWEFVKKPEHANATMAIFTFLILVATVAYAVIALLQWGSMKESNRISRESLESVQRAFIAYKTTQSERTKSGDRIYWNFQTIFENSGNTPAIDAVSATWIGEVGGEISEPLFKHLAGPAISTTIAAKTTQAAMRTPWDESDLFGENLGDKFENFPAHLRPDFYLYGWMVYRDVLPNTPAHLTEYCRRINSVDLLSGDPMNIRFNFEDCRQHNCTDQYCPDYSEMVALADSQTAK